MEGYRAALESPSVSVAVGVHRKLVFSAACGYADIETRTLATTETVYAIGSVSKPITAALTVALWEDGVLNLDMNVREYVPDPDRIEALARANPAAASGAALEEAATFQPVAPARRLAQLAALLAEDGGCDIGQLAARCGVTAKHASRACKRWFGEPPVRLRQEGRPRRAIALLLDGASPVEAALDARFSDQPHLTRLLKQATGFTPARLVRS
jgi:AraC-like DNA-binding protein